MVRLAAGKSDAVVVVAVVFVLVLVIALVFSRHILWSIDLLVNFQSAYPHPVSDRVNLGDHVFEHAIATTCHEISHEDRNSEVNVRCSVIRRVLSRSSRS